MQTLYEEHRLYGEPYKDMMNKHAHTRTHTHTQ